jgi:hypothetical protein
VGLAPQILRALTIPFEQKPVFCIMLSCLLSVFLIFGHYAVAPAAPSTLFPAACRVKGTATVKATGLGIPYNNKFDLIYDLRIHIDPSSRKASIDVTHKGHTSTVKGMLINDSTIQLSLDQDCPQNFDGDGFSATLTGTVKKGFLTCIDNKVRMFAHLDATGKIEWQGLSVPVTGTVETDAHS